MISKRGVKNRILSLTPARTTHASTLACGQFPASFDRGECGGYGRFWEQISVAIRELLLSMSGSEAPLSRSRSTAASRAAANHPPVRFGQFQLTPMRRQLLESGRPVKLGARAFDILALLVERAGELVSKEELMARA